MPHNSTSPRILMFVEDPGAANFVVPLLAGFDDLDVSYRLLAQGKACRYLIDRRVEFESLPLHADAKAILLRWQPDVVAFGTAENCDTWAWQLLQHSRALDVPTVGLVDSSVNAAFRFRGRSENPLHHLPDWVIVPDQPALAAFVELGAMPSRILECGHPNHDRIVAMQETHRRDEVPGKSFTQDNGARIVFLSELSDAIGGGFYKRDDGYSLAGTGTSDLRTHVVLDEFLAACDAVIPNAHRVLRLHPKQGEQDLSNYLDRFHELSAGGDPIEVVRDADLVVGMTTALLDEAALLGKPTLSIVPRELEKHWNASIQWGATVVVWQRDNLRDQLRSFASTGELERSHDCQLPTMGAVDRVTKALADIANRTNGATRSRQEPMPIEQSTDSRAAIDQAIERSAAGEAWIRRRQAC